MLKFSKIFLIRFSIISIMLIHCLNTSKAQNYIRNGGFENMIQSTSNQGQFDGYVYDWDADRCACDNNGSSVPNTHSPDIHGKSTFGSPGSFPNGPHDGDRFAGFGAYEIMEQQINTLPNNEKMIFTMYIKLDNTVLNANYSSLFLKVYLAKQKIEYKEGKFCEPGYTEYKDPFPWFPQNIVEVFSTPITLSAYPIFDSWYEVKFIFTTPSNGVYDWIGIDLITNNPSGLCNDGYLGVDDISLVPLCDNFCVDPDRVPATYGYYSNGIYHAGFYATQPGVGYNLNGVFHPFALYIENATHIKFEIFSNAQQVMYSVEYFDYAGIVNPNYNDFLLLWDGKSDFGGCLPQDEYVYKILIENCVSYVSYTDKLAFLGPHITGCHVIPPLYNTSVPNCCDENAFYNFTSFSGVDRTDVNNLISAGVTGNVTILSGANIIWHAGQDIELGLFFQANQGSDFEASIVPCGTLRPSQIEIDDRLFNYNSKEYGDSNIELTLFPNPTTDLVNINSNLQIMDIEIFNLHGQLIQTLPYSKELHVATLPNGIYFLNFQIKSSPSIRLKLIKN